MVTFIKLVQFAFYLLIRTEEPNPQYWKEFQSVISQYINIPHFCRGYLAILEDWCNLISELVRSDAFAASGTHHD